MRSILRRLEDLEKVHTGEICAAFFWVRKGHEQEDEQRQKIEFVNLYRDLPDETYYQIFSLDAPNESYEDFTHRIRDKRSFEQWWKEQTLRGVPCHDYKDAWKNLKKL